MATIGHNRAMAEIGGRKFSGFFTWLLWSVIHVFLLVGFRNRLTVTREWLWAYFKRESSTPLITEHGQGGLVLEPIKIEASKHVKIEVKR